MFDKQRSTFVPTVHYIEPVAAIAWLEQAFGFEPAIIITDDSGALHFAEMRLDEAQLHIANEWSETAKSPRSTGGRHTQSISVNLRGDIDAHCERARAAGAHIEREPSNRFYGDRNYCALDLEGHFWTFAKQIEEVPLEAVARDGVLIKDYRSR